MILYHELRPTLSIPDHRELAPGLLRGLIRRAGLTVEEFLKKNKSSLSQHSKSTLFRIFRSLEEKGLIKKRGEG
jgi:DNA-binding transcriptional ArsR family regulator